MKRSALFLICCGLLSLTGSEFSPGGVTFPMEKISAERYSIRKSASPNLLGTDLKQWKSSIWIFGSKLRRAHLGHTRKIATQKIVKVDGQDVLELNRPAALEKLLKENVRSFSSAFTRSIRLPDTSGGSYKLTFNKRNQLIGSKQFSQYVIFGFRDGSDPRMNRGKKTGRGVVRSIASSSQWNPCSLEFSVPPKTRDLEIVIRGNGCGILQAKDLKLEKPSAVKTAVTVELSPMKLLDNTYFLASDTPGAVGFRFKSDLPKGKLAMGKNYRFCLELPEAVRVLESNSRFGRGLARSPFTFNGRKYFRYTVDCSFMISRIRSIQGFNGWHIPGMLLQGSGKAGERLECFYYVTDNGKLISAKNSFTLQFMEKLPKVAQPKQFLTGFCSVPADVQFNDNGEKMGKFFADRGVNIAVGGWRKPYRDQLRKGGIPLLTCQTYPIANGFRIGQFNEKNRPADSIYRDAEGKPVIRHGTVSTCPYAVYSKGEYYTKYIVPLVKRIVSNGTDGLQPNWEPWWWRNRGCFCDNCRREFAKFAKMSLAEVKKIWPRKLQQNEKLSDTVIRFRAWQHAKLIETMHKLTLSHGLKMGFFPEVGTSQVIRHANYNKTQGEFTPYAYADKLKWLNVWGPYIFFTADQPYSYVKGAHVYFFNQSLRVLQNYGQAFPDKNKRAKLQAMPHGSQGDMRWLGQPEGLAMDQISAFLAGYHSSVLYFFPRYYDHRYWKAFAESNAAIARNEDMVLNGKPYPHVSVKALTPFATRAQFYARGLNGRYELIRAIAFKKGSRILAAAGNFWEKGDVVFELRVSGLAPAKRFTVQEKAFKRCFTGDKGSFTGADLARGIKLHAGALRWAFFEITPEIKDAGIKITASRMNSLQKEVAARTAKASLMEKQLDKVFDASNDRGQLKNCAFGKLKCKAVNGRLEIVSGKNSAVIDPEGMALVSWIVNGSEQGAENHALTGFWTPGKRGFQCSGIFRITDQKADARGLTVTGTMTTSVSRYPQLPGLAIRKTFHFSPDLTRVTITAELQNSSKEEEMSGIGFRWTLFPAPWSNRLAGTISIAGRSFPRFRRQGLMAGAVTPGCESVMRRLFQVKSPTDRIKGNTFIFEDRTKNRFRCTLLPAGLFGGVGIWDSPDMPVATFEPFYKELDLGPGGKAVFQLKLDSLNGK